MHCRAGLGGAERVWVALGGSGRSGRRWEGLGDAGRAWAALGGFVHLSSAGVTRPDRPGLDLSKQPPAVRLNKELDFILTFKLKLFRFCTLISFGDGGGLNTGNGIPYTIVRPCALTEEPAGTDLIFNQGDNITVYNQIEDHYSLFVVSL
ncbi:unnamed protein product [Prunus armeniaca]